MNRPAFAIALCTLVASACGDGRSAPAAPAGSAAAHVDAVSEAAASYELRAAFSPAAVARGAPTTLAVEIVMRRPDVHVQREFPLKIALAASPGVTLSKAALGHADAVDPGAKGRRWEIPATAGAAGAQRADASLRFAICKEAEPAWCVTRTETLGASLDVR
jgi:hypothetical protein